MVKRLLFYGDMQDHMLARRLYHTLRSRVPVSFCNGDALLERTALPQIELLEADHLRLLEADNTLLYLKQRCDLRSFRQLDGDLTVVVDSSNRAQLRFAARYGLNTVTYGCSAKDTLTFSSREESRPVVALQRSVCTLDRTVVEPMEIPCLLSGRWRDRALLSYVLLLLLLGELRLEPDGGLNLTGGL